MFAVQQPGHRRRYLPVDFLETRAVAGEPTLFRAFRKLIDRRHPQIRRLALRTTDASTLSADAPAACAASTAGPISSTFDALWFDTSIPRERAASTMAPSCSGDLVVGSTSAAIRRAPGTSSSRSSWRLP